MKPETRTIGAALIPDQLSATQMFEMRRKLSRECCRVSVLVVRHDGESSGDRTTATHLVLRSVEALRHQLRYA
jgi:hypothetical protein